MIEAPTEPVPPSEPPPAPRRYPLRFVWQIDAEDRFTIGSDEFIGFIGPHTAAALGRPWSEVDADLGLDAEGHVMRALATHETWSGLVVAWPVDEAGERLAVELSALPVFDRDRAFRGYRGFGVCRDLAQLAALAQRRRATAVEAPPAESEETASSPPVENVVPFPASSPPEVKAPSLSPGERNAFHEIARRLTERLNGPGPEGEKEGAEAVGKVAEAVRECEKPHREIARLAPAESAFLARIGDELRSPLTNIIAFCEAMMEERFGPLGDERYRTSVADIAAHGGRLIALVENIRALSRIEAGEIELDFTSLALNDLVQQCVAGLQPHANEARVIIRSSLSPKLPPVVADAATLRQIVSSLVANSIARSGAAGQVIVSTALTDGGEVALRVRDASAGTNDNTDLTLRLARALAEANRANFHVDSKCAGTLVEISFPATCLWSE